ncbi:DUF2868 domain-containing protein [Corticibacter populi]|nr:DUF2868 domain-containing protein [Corticibacter populi]RZS30188.1 uncharacterized protein DUF2868 [Corticibacter populi]
MNEQQLRDILLAKAIETEPAQGQPALLDQEQAQAATEQALYELRDQQRLAPSRRLSLLLQRRAERIVRAALAMQPQLAALRQPNRQVHWLYAALPLLAFLTGFLGDRIGEPHRVDLLAAPLLAIIGWNLLAYAFMLLGGLRRLQPAAAAGAASATDAPVALWRSLWSRRWLPLAQDRQLGTLARAFRADWAPYAQALHRRYWRRSLHWSAAALALGVTASLWTTGLLTEYRIGWESTLLQPTHLQGLLNALTWPARTLLQQPPWTLEQVQALQAWPSGNRQGGLQWITAYSILLAVCVVLPRLLMGLYQEWRAHHQARHLSLPLQTQYFQKLARDFASDALSISVQPFDMAINAARQQQLRNFIQAQFGSAAHVVVAPTLQYGDGDGGKSAFTAVDDSAPSLRVLLFNLAATPEREIQGRAIEQLSQSPQAQGSECAVWLYAHELAERLGDGQHQRLEERKHLWQGFAEAHGVPNVRFIGG